MARLPDNGFLLGRNHTTPRAGVGFGRVANDHVFEAIEEFLVDSSDGHGMIFAPTGAGKKRNILMPTLLSSTNSMIVLDVKGELARESAAHRRDLLGQDVHILDPWKLVTDTPDSFNPLDVIDPQDEGLADDCFALSSLLVDQAPIKEAYWDDSAQAVVAGLICHVVECAKENDRSLRRVWQLANADDPIYGLASLLDTMPVHPFARAQIASLLSLSADNTRSCILSVMHQHLRVFASERVHKAVERTSFDLEKLRSGAPFTLYVVVPWLKLKSHAPLLRLWLSALMNVLFSRESPPERPTLLLLDEAAQLGRMDQIPQAITLARGFGVRCLLFLQSHAQLRTLYPNDHEVLMENCATLATFGHTGFSMSQGMANALGDIAADQLFAMSRNEIAVRRAYERTRIVSRLDYVNDPELAGLAAPDRMHPTQNPPPPRAAGQR